MLNSRNVGEAVTTVGGSFPVLLAAAPSLSLYGEALSGTKSAVLMVCAVSSVLVLSIGRYLQSADARTQKRGRRGKQKNAMPGSAMRSEDSRLSSLRKRLAPRPGRGSAYQPTDEGMPRLRS